MQAAVVSSQCHTVRALRVGRDGSRFERSCPVPEPSAGEVSVRPLCVAVSRLDVEIARGLLGFDGVPGRSCVGIVESASGHEFAELVGARVAVSPLVICGRCDMCRMGAPLHCRSREILGMIGRDGCLSDAVVVPGSNAISIAGKHDEDSCAFATSVGTALHIARRVESGPRTMVTVLGDGHLGLLVAQVLLRTAPRVRVVGHYSEKLALCEKWGIKHRHADDVGRRSDQDVVVDCTGSPDGLLLATDLARPRGRIILPSLHRPEAFVPLRTQFSLAGLVLKEIDLVAVGIGSVQEGIALLARREIDVLSLISRRARLDDGAAILDAASQPGHITTLVSI